jgi:hypothetical protein
MINEEHFDELWIDMQKQFDWQKVYNVMKLLDWHWHFNDNTMGIPSISTLQKNARYLMKAAFKRPGCIAQAGGFSSIYSEGKIDLKFVLEFQTV